MASQMMRFIQLCLTVSLIGSTLTSCGKQSVDTKLVSLRLYAPGMHCDGCVETLEATFKKLDGIDSVKADLKTKNVVIIADTLKVSVAKMNQLIERLGFSQSFEQEL